MAGRLGNFHGMWFDQEHAAIPHADLELMMIACRAAGKDGFARVPPNDYATIMRPYEAGCSGVMVAQVRTLAEVEQAVEWAKYPPAGKRGFYGGNAETGFGQITMATQVAAANRSQCRPYTRRSRAPRARSSFRACAAAGPKSAIQRPGDRREGPPGAGPRRPPGGPVLRGRCALSTSSTRPSRPSATASSP
jgi:hypothetical protein